MVDRDKSDLFEVVTCLRHLGRSDGGKTFDCAVIALSSDSLLSSFLVMTSFTSGILFLAMRRIH